MDDKTLLSQFLSFNEEIKQLTISGDIDSLRSRFLELRGEVQKNHPKALIFNPPLYLEDPSDYNLTQIQNETNSLIDLLIKEIQEEQK